MDFQQYVKTNWRNVGRNEKGWFITRDSAWTMQTMREEGWNAQATGERELTPDDTIRVYFSIAKA